MNNVIEVENLSKKYTMGEREKYLALRDVMVKAAKVPINLLKGKRFVKKGEFWALKDVDFTVRQGEVVGIIGRNGAGKSTLLKILSRITEPTNGVIKIRGRISSLLEVGTGFHPELTGRENIYLNGAILGMAKREIDRKFDKIVEFSGVEKFLDTPVKRYSSGMQVRLAFSVAAHLEPDILVIDEVLAVGDAEFQKKCLGKMDEVTREAGRTILFVSHDMGAIRRICSRVIVLDQGSIVFEGNVSEGIEKYFVEQTINKPEIDFTSRQGLSEKKLYFKKARILNQDSKETIHFEYGDKVRVEVEFKVNKGIENPVIGVELINSEGISVFTTTSQDAEGTVLNTMEPGDYVYSLKIDTALYTRPGSYYLNFNSAIPKVEFLDIPNDTLYFNVVDGKRTPSYLLGHGRKGVVEPTIEWVKSHQKNYED